MIRLTLLCAAATGATRRNAFPDGEPIEAAGRDAAARLRGSLPAHGRAVTSPALPARETAEAAGMAATVDPMLADLDLGLWSGRDLSAVEAEAPAGLAAWLSDPAAAPHGGESLVALDARIGAWLAARSRERGRVLAVTHAAPIRAAVLRAIGAPLAGFWRIDVPPLAVVTLTGVGGRWNLRLGNGRGSDGAVAPGSPAGQTGATTDEGGEP